MISVIRKKKDASSMIEVALPEGVILRPQSTLAISIRERLVSMREPRDTKFAIVCEGTHHKVIHTLPKSTQQLRSAIDVCLYDLKVLIHPEAAVLPRGLAVALALS